MRFYGDCGGRPSWEWFFKTIVEKGEWTAIICPSYHKEMVKWGYLTDAVFPGEEVFRLMTLNGEVYQQLCNDGKMENITLREFVQVPNINVRVHSVVLEKLYHCCNLDYTALRRARMSFEIDDEIESEYTRCVMWWIKK